MLKPFMLLGDLEAWNGGTLKILIVNKRKIRFVFKIN